VHRCTNLVITRVLSRDANPWLQLPHPAEQIATGIHQCPTATAAATITTATHCHWMTHAARSNSRTNSLPKLHVPETGSNFYFGRRTATKVPASIILFITELLYKNDKCPRKINSLCTPATNTHRSSFCLFVV
jgi:hypothetical protein